MEKQSVRRKRIYLFGVPIDKVPPDQFHDVIDTLLAEEKPSQIIFIEWWDIIRALFKSEYRAMLRHARLVIPTTASIVIGARMLRYKNVTRYDPFNFIIKLLAILESRNSTLYLVGMDLQSIQEVEHNIKDTFPKLRIVGRHPGYFSARQEKSVVIAIRKSAPTLLLAGIGFYSQDAWLYKIKHNINSSIIASSRITFSILANRSRRPAMIIFRSGLECIPKFLKSPWRIYRLPVFIIYFFSLVCCRIFRVY